MALYINDSLPCKADNYDTKSNGRTIEYIVTHWVGAASSAEQNAKNFHNNTQNPKKSAHFFVDSKSIYSSVPVDKIASHCGSSSGAYFSACRNKNSIGVEICCAKDKSTGELYLSKDALNNAAFLIASLMSKYGIGIRNVIRHYDVTHKDCPAPFAPTSTSSKVNEQRDSYWNLFKECILGSRHFESNLYEDMSSRKVDTKSGTTKEQMALPALQAVAQLAINIASNDNYGYSQANRTGEAQADGKKYFDCSSFVYHCFYTIGHENNIADFANVAKNGYGNTDTLVSDFTANGFSDIGKSTPASSLKVGDVLIRQKSDGVSTGHTAIVVRVSGGTVKIAHASSGNKEFKDQITVRDYYDGNWTHVLRYQKDAGSIYVDFSFSEALEVTGTSATYEWGKAAPSIADESSIVEQVEFSNANLEVTDDMYLGSEIIHSLKDKVASFGAGYLIYFDDQLMNRYVTSFSCDLGISGDIVSANIELLYAPSFWKTEIRDSNLNLYRSKDAIENMTSVRIFVMNIITRKFDIIFDGVVRAKHRKKGTRGRNIVITANCHMEWLNRISVPVSIPLNQRISIGDQIKWLGQGIDLEKVNSIIFNAESGFKGKYLSEFLMQQVQKTFLNNTLFQDPNSVMAWDDAPNRLCVMGDIDKQLVEAQCVDFIVSSSVELVDTMYSVLNRTCGLLLIEYFADRDGLIRIKPPYWNQPVLKDHIIDPMFILDEDEYTDYSSFYTRIIATGGNEEWQLEGGRGQYVRTDFLTPVGVYKGNMEDSTKAFWADFTGIPVTFTTTGAGYWMDEKQVGNAGNGIDTAIEENRLRYRDAKTVVDSVDKAAHRTVRFFENFVLATDFRETKKEKDTTLYHTGIDFRFTRNGKERPVYCPAPGAIVVSVLKDYMVADTKNEPDASRKLSTVTMQAGEYIFTFAHLDTVTVKQGDVIKLGASIGRVKEGLYYGRARTGSSGTQEQGHWHFSIHKSPMLYIDPIKYFVDKGYCDETIRENIQEVEGIAGDQTEGGAAVQAGESLGGGVTLNTNDLSYLKDLLLCSDDEKKYGPSIYEINQSLIRFSTAQAVTQDAADPAAALRRYSQFIYYMLNSSLDTCRLTTIAMPWLRPGFNVWLNPVDDDKVYYLNSISYSGSPTAGVTSSLSLGIGRERQVFATSPKGFGAMKDTCDNLLISNIFQSQKVESFGDIIADNSVFERIKRETIDFYSNDEEEVLSEYSKHYQDLYGNVNESPDAPKLAEQIEANSVDRLINGACSMVAFKDQEKLSQSKDKIFTYPLRSQDADRIGTITNGYGDGHKAIDILCDSEDSVVAVSKGTIFAYGRNGSGEVLYLYVNISDDNRHAGKQYIVVYSHLGEIDEGIKKAIDEKGNFFASDEDTVSFVLNKLGSGSNIHSAIPTILQGYPYKASGAKIAQAGKGDLHIAVSKIEKSDSGYSAEYVNPCELINPAQGGSAIAKISYNSDLFASAQRKAQIGGSIMDVDEFASSSSDFCKSDKFFRKEMSYAEIDEKIKSIYSSNDCPAVIKNRKTALAARISEADKFIEKFYDFEDMGTWADIKKLKDYVSENEGYITGKWVEGALDTDETFTSGIKVGLANFDSEVVMRGVQSGTINAAEATGINIGFDGVSISFSEKVHYPANALTITNYLKTKGYNNAIIAGLLANIYSESGFKPNNVGDNGTSFGLCQWHDGRGTKMKNATPNWETNITGQLDYLISEGDFKTVLDKQQYPNTQQGACDFGFNFCVFFERPKNKEQKGSSRGTLAAGYFEYLEEQAQKEKNASQKTTATKKTSTESSNFGFSDAVTNPYLKNIASGN